MAIAEEGRVLQLASIGPLADGALRSEFGASRLWEERDPAAWIAAHGKQGGRHRNVGTAGLR